MYLNVVILNFVMYTLINRFEFTVQECPIGFVYHKESSSCYTPYIQGPCEEREYLLLSGSYHNSMCKKNPCKNGYFKYEGSCVPLGGPCFIDDNQFPKTLQVNPVNLKVECMIYGKNRIFYEYY